LGLLKGKVEMSSPHKILLFGPRINKKNPAKIGGVIVLFEDLIKQ